MMLAILFSLKSMEMLENGLQQHSGASLQSCYSVDANAWCKWALIKLPVTDPRFPGLGGGNLKDEDTNLLFWHFSQKLYEIEKKNGPRGGTHPLHPLDR